MSSAQLDYSALCGHLWEAANLLRGPVDAADFKTYIFPLLFFKRLSDVYDEEVRQLLADSDGDEEYARFPENHKVQIPDGCHWADVRKVTENVGQALQTAMRAIEAEERNAKQLFGIFGDAPWSNKDRLSDELLTDLLEHFSALPLPVGAVSADAIGDAYEFLIKQFADKSNKKAGEFYTPRSVVALMVRILAPRDGETIYDPACGTGGMLLAAVQYVKDRTNNSNALLGKLFGQEKNLTTSAIARMNLLLHDVEDAKIHRGDTLREPNFLDGDSLMQFDCVVANPPFSLEKWGEDKWPGDPYGRNIAGTPPAKSGDYAWVQHMLASLKANTGRMAVVLPHGALFRMAAEGKIRKKILEMDVLEAVIGLGPNLFYGTGLAACILVFRKRKPEARKRQVLLVDASRLFKKGRNQNELLPDHADRIFQLYTEYADAPGEAKVVSLDDVLTEHDGNLNISLYVEPPQTEKVPSVAEALDALKTSLAAAYAAEDRLAELLRANGLMPVEE
ncbi:MAG TPA: class I SAM-dependent DNA methyltransferase [Gemmata sp.]